MIKHKICKKCGRVIDPYPSMASCGLGASVDKIFGFCVCEQPVVQGFKNE